jgi:hypothetical protein
LDASAISDEVIAARGYRSMEKKADLERLGFARRQQIVPALLIPLHGVTGERTGYLMRPDEPRVVSGRIRKYEIPANSGMMVDVPPAVRGRLGDPTRPLFITEGSRKADAAVSIGLDCISLIGVWNWRGTNELGGKTALADFESIALNSREVYVVFDSDLMVKEAVHAALVRLSGFLKTRGARLRFVYLPPGEGGAKVGLDDFIAAGAGPAELFALASSELRPLQGAPAKAEYEETEDGIFWHKRTKQGHEPVQLTNFGARIIADVVKDDGVEEERVLEIEASLKGRQRRFRLPAGRFAPMNWVIEEIGAGAAVEPGQSLRDRARHAIQVNSGDPPRRRVYTHLGWRDVDGESVYLHAGGAVGAGGELDTVEVELTGALESFRLPSPPSGPDLVEAVRSSATLADIAAADITLPLLGAIYRAPLGPSDFSVFIVGPTGALKTATAAVCQQHWGETLDERNLPESFRSTANAIEGLLFQAKDTLLVVDEFAPGGSQAEVTRAHRDADRVLRSPGNRAGRARMTADASLRNAKRPRGLTLVTGEDVPKGQSLRARIFVVEVEPGAIDAGELLALQADANSGLLAQAMAGYVHFLAPRYPEIRTRLRAEREAVRDELLTTGQHRRTPALVADLLIGVRYFLQFAKECGAMTHEQTVDFERRARAALCGAAERQAGHQRDAEPTSRFRTLVASAIASGVAHVADADGSMPASPAGWGWRRDDDDASPRAQGKRIGWLHGDDLLLDPDAALAAAQAVAGNSDSGVTINLATLRKRLHERGLLATTELESRQTMTVRRTIEGQRRAVLHVIHGFLEPDHGESISNAGTDHANVPSDEEGSAGSGSESRLTNPSTTGDPGRETKEGVTGQVGQVKKEEAPAAVGSVRGGGATGIGAPSRVIAEPIPTPAPAQTDHDAAEVDVERDEETVV